MLPSLSLPPLEFCFGTSPIQAEKSRPDRNALGSPMLATSAVASAGPTPGMASSRLAERIDVYSLNAIGLRLYRSNVGQATIASRETVRGLIQDAAAAVSGHKFGLRFLLAEWDHVVDVEGSRRHMPHRVMIPMDALRFLNISSTVPVGVS